jgi:gliding motility-associated-like protein
MNKNLPGNCSNRKTGYDLISASEEKIRYSDFLKVCAFLFFCLLTGLVAFSQPFVPVAVTGFNHDVIAETGTSSLTTTTIALDAVPASNRVMYSNAFRIANGFGGGGLPDNGTITDAAGTYQLGSYVANNALLLQRTQTGNLTLTTAAKFSTIRVLGFTTEGTSLINVTLHFTDATVTNVLVNYALSDWFNTTANLVLSGFGRCTRATPAASADGFPSNPRMYYVNIPLSCTDKQKTLEKISFQNVTTAGTNAPYPNSVFLAVSGISTSTASISAAITDAGCSTNGSATLTIGNVQTPYTIAWNTIPAQTGPTATNLPAGTYQATIRDANGCDTIFPVTIALINNLTMTVHADTSVCTGSSFNANTISNAANYSWSPINDLSNPAIANPVITPTATRFYTVTGTTGVCSISKSFTVTFKEKALAKFGYSINQCSSDPVQFFDSSTINGGSINQWKWIYNGTIFNTIKDPARLFPQGTHTVRLVVNGTGGCESDTTDHTFTFNEKPTINMNFNDACKLTPVDFTASETSSLGVGNWFWRFGDGGIATGSPAQHTYNSGGNFPVKLVGKASNGCNSDTLNNTIIIYATNAFAGNDITTASGQPVQLQASGGISYEWTPATGLSNPFISNPVATLTGSQIYTYVVRAYTPLGCQSFDTIKIQVYEAPEIYLPGAFTPGGVTVNNIYRALPVGIKEFRYLRIFNRYGQQIFYTTNAQVGWNGTWKGKPQNSGVYVVIASGIDFRGTVINRQATVMLIR